MSATTRYAVYYAPEAGHPLWQAGCDWLGRDPRRADSPGAPPAQRAEPWRYGFHATLKPPLRLAPGCDEAAFERALQALAARTAPFEMPRLHVDTLANFIALRPAEPLAREHPLWRLADACVTTLDPFRAPLDAAELARRLKQPLDAESRQRLDAWGYPHVLEGWRFHMTLSDSLDDTAPLLAAAREHFAAALQATLRCTELCLFTQAVPGLPFLLKCRYRLAAVASGWAD